MKIKDLVRSNILEIVPYTPPKPIKEIERELNIRDITLLMSNENPRSASQEVIQAIQNELNNINRYPEGGAFYLRKALAKKLKVMPQNIILGNGGDEILSMICETFLNPEEEVIIGQPSFSAYEIFCRISGGKPVFVNLNNYTYDLNKIIKKINSRTKIIFICNPNNPTGTIVTQNEVEYFLKHVPPRIIVVLDEAYMEYVENNEFPNSIEFIKKRYENIISIRTFSKIYSMAGLRIGYGISSFEIIKYLNLVRKPYNVNSLAQAGALASILNPKIITQSRRINQEGKKYLYDSFEKMGFFYVPTEANFILVRVGNNARLICEKLLSNSLLVRSGVAIGYPEFIRVTIGLDEENKKFIKSLSKIKDYL
ncbi:MAG: histidinol-phosphate transaminase [Candidatus Firestonebacteria bacterium]|nr:histidinol-phosphate transaminase [Candidatus Firestonebacteria bacterium]